MNLPVAMRDTRVNRILLFRGDNFLYSIRMDRVRRPITIKNPDSGG